MKHTPGPWMFEFYEPEKKTEVCTVAHVGDYRVGFETPGYPGGNYRDSEYGHEEADARLIAAAPTLLEALKGLVEAFPGPVDDWRYADARAALASAEGE